MNAEKFAHFIKNPAHLYQVTYLELKSLVLQYPYCQNLRYLLLKKSQLEAHPDYDKNLQLAATFSSDRPFLYQQIQNKESFSSEEDNFLIKEDYLELKEINTPDTPAIEEESEAIVNPALEAPATEYEEDIISEDGTANSDNPPENEAIREEETPAEVNLEPEPASPPPQEQAIEPFVEVDISEEEIVDITDEVELDDEEPEPEPALEIENEEPDRENPEPPAEENVLTIEDLIRLDSLSPLERLQQSQQQKKHTEKTDRQAPERAKTPSNLEHPTEKEKIPFEITNEEELNVRESQETLSPTPKTSFGSWLKQFQAPELSIQQDIQKKIVEKKLPPLEPKEPKEPKSSAKEKKEKKPTKQKNVHSKDREKKKKKKFNPIAEKSLQERDDIASETLAALLVRQESYEKAITMYERLSLLFPEKSSFFADQIEKLKKL